MALEAVFNQAAKEAMLKDLQKYKTDKNSAKEFYPCTQELSKWLEEKKSK
ncbi:MAG: hypothetical protein ABGW85_03015 [Sulfurimonas sp.]|jgi:hypothetical protein